MSRWVRAAFLAGVLLAAAGQAATAPPAPGLAEQLIATSGGVYRDPALARYVRAVGVRLVAAAQDDGTVAVQAFEGEAEAGGPAAKPIVEGTMVLADDYPAAPAAGPFALAGGRPSRFSPEDLYRDVMFHGPAFRGVAAMDRWGEVGATATLKTLPADGLFASTRTPALVTTSIRPGGRRRTAAKNVSLAAGHRRQSISASAVRFSAALTPGSRISR